MADSFNCLPYVIAFFLTLSSQDCNAEQRSFDVRDSIEMATFSEPSQFDPQSRPIFSPDGNYFCVITTRGVIRSDKVESTLRVFSMNSINSFLSARDTERPPNSRVIATILGTPNIRSNAPYEPIILEPQWSPDSKSIYFLVQNAYDERQIFAANMSGGQPRSLTPEGRDVFQYDVAKGTIAFLYTDSALSKVEDTRRAVPGAHLTKDARVVTGLSLGEIIFPELSSGRWFVHDKLAFIRDEKIHERSLRNPADQPLHLLEGNGPSILSISPEGRFAIELLPVHDVPNDWEAFEPAQGQPRLRAGSREDKAAPEENAPREYTIIDLDTGSTMSLAGPNGRSLGYSDQALAKWSRDGHQVLLTNTFLSLDGGGNVDRSRRLYPCAAAIIEMPARLPQCLTRSKPSTFDPDGLGTLIDASFERGGTEVALTFRKSDELTVETYRDDKSAWKLSTSARGNVGKRSLHKNAGDPISIDIAQTLNDPPTLWATEMATGRSREIWNPNPQLSALRFGEASVYRWSDEAGHEWSAGLIKPIGYVPGTTYPLVIQTHGFEEGRFLTDGAFPTAMAARPLASAGMVVLQMSTRHSRGDRTLEEATDQVVGFKSAIKQLVADGLVDPLRVGIIGFSRTCWYVESALIKFPSLFAAATIADGIDGSFVGRLLFGKNSQYDEFYGGSPIGDRLKNWYELAPDFHRSAIATPVRLEAHTRGSILGEWGIYSSLSMQNKPVDLIYFPSGQHILQKPLERVASQQGDVDWFRFWLQGYEDPAPSKADQYRHWEQLCDMQKSQNPDRLAICVTTMH